MLPKHAYARVEDSKKKKVMAVELAPAFDLVVLTHDFDSYTESDFETSIVPVEAMREKLPQLVDNLVRAVDVSLGRLCACYVQDVVPRDAHERDRGNGGPRQGCSGSVGFRARFERPGCGVSPVGAVWYTLQGAPPIRESCASARSCGLDTRQR
jgi:hypothetical protein